VNDSPRPLPRLLRGLIALLTLLRLRRRKHTEDESAEGHGPSYGSDPSPADEQAAGAQRETDADPAAELAVAAALVLAGALGAAFCLVYALDRANTQLLGLTLGLALISIAAALILAADRVFPRETAVEPRPQLAETREGLEADVAETLAAGTEGLSRRRLLVAAASTAGVGLGAAALVPLDSLGPNVGQTLDTTPWRHGAALVDETRQPIRADTVIEGSFITAFPQGADMSLLGSPIVVVRVNPAALRLPAGRGGWAPDGIVAYSKICTHAGCAVSLYRSPLDQSTAGEGPALVCPCHYSTFDVLDGASVEFGPAGRPLPQLPLAVRADGVLIAAGGFSGPIGPAWWSVRREGPTRS
jgi:ubiquinol-cytochrome c reductase iron-sulfur subunit